MGGSSSVTVADRQTTIQTQQSSYGQPIPVQFGTNRGAGNLVWFANFQADAHTTTAGKGGGSSSNTTYTYKASAILAICEGPIAGIGQVWKDTELTTLTDLGLTLFTGAPDQAVWSFLSGYSTSGNWANDLNWGYNQYGSSPAFVSQAINYSGTAYVAASAYDLSDSATVPNHNFEIKGFNIVGGGNPDANPADIIKQVLFNQQFGIGFSSSWVDSLSSGAASYETYCQALGLFVSPYYSQQRPGTDVIKEMAETTNAGPVWSGGKLKVIPYGDTAITGNGATYSPNVTPLFDLDPDDCLDTDEESPVLVTRTSPADAYNRVSVQFRNRANQYNQEVVYAEDQDAIEKYGLKIAPTITLDCICVSSIAKQIAQLALQRYLYKRNTYEFELVGSYPMLEPMDVLTITDLPQGIDRVPVRITEIEEQDHSYRVTAEDMMIGVAAAPTYAYDDGVRWSASFDNAPLDAAAPVIFELPADPSATGLSVALAAGGQATDLNYGGCRVWLSLDGVHYREQGTIWGSSRYGTLSAGLAGHASGMDTTNTAHLSLTSNGQMLSGSSADVAQGTTLMVCNGEYFAYQNASLTGVRAYDLTTLNRGLYGTTAGSHASGSTWVRVDDTIARLADLDLTMIGQTIFIKLTAFNVYGRAEQDLSSVGAYSYTITGNMKALESPVTLAQAIVGQGDLATSNKASLPFGANTLPNSEMTLVDPAVNTTIPFAWIGAWQGNSSNLGSLSFNDRRVQLLDGSYAFARDVTGTPNGTVVDCVVPNYSSYAKERVLLPVLPGDRLAASALIGHQGCTSGVVEIGFYDDTGAYVGEYGGSNVVKDIGTSVYSNFTRATLALASATATVPADGTLPGGNGRCRFAAIWTRFNINGSTANPRMITAAPLLTKVPAGQTAIPPYTPGPSDRVASYGAVSGVSLVSQVYGTLPDNSIVTSLGTAAAISGQTAWATYGILTPQQIATPGGNLVFNGGLSLKFQKFVNSTGWSWNSGSAGDIPTYLAASNNAGSFLTTDWFPVSPSNNYTASMWAGANGTATGSNRPLIYLDYADASKNYLGSVGGTYVPMNAGFSTVATTANMPSTARFARVIIYTGTLAGSGPVYASNIKCELGSTATPFNDWATNGALYQSGQNIDTLQPAEAGSDVTGSHTAAAIAGQASWATFGGYTPTSLMGRNQNYVYNPCGLLQMDGWTSAAGGGAVTAGPGQAGEGYFFHNSSANNSGGLFYYQDHPIQAGTIVSLQAWIYSGGLTMTSGTLAQARFYIEWLNSSGGHIGYTTTCAANHGAGWTFCSVTSQTAPAGTATARLIMDIWGDGAWSNTNASWTKIKVELGSECTPFTDDASYGATYQSGQTIDALKPAQAGADVTGSHTASAIIGQAATATNSDYSVISGTKPPTNATNGAPYGTPVGGIYADDVSSTINSGGGVANNQVPTSAMQPNSVTAPGSTYLASPYDVTTFGGWVTVLSFTGTFDGYAQLLSSWTAVAAYGSSASGNRYYTFELRLDGTALHHWGKGSPIAEFADSAFWASISGFEAQWGAEGQHIGINSVSPGSHTFDLRVSLNGTWNSGEYLRVATGSNLITTDIKR